MKCVVVDDNPIQRAMIANYVSDIGHLELVGEYDSARALIAAGTQFDVAFLDIEMPEMTGLDFLKSANQDFQVILVTSEEKYAVESYNYAVTDYLVKPVAFDRFYTAVSKLSAPAESSDCLFLKEGRTIERVRFDDILCIKAAVDYIEVVCKDRKVLSNSSMNKVITALPKQFMRIHRSSIINLDYIKSIDATMIEMEHSKEVLKIGASYKKEVLDRINYLS